MERKLVSIQRVLALYPIENKDRIEIAKINGWQCIVKKGEFQVGDLGVFHEIDTIVDKDNPTYSFLKTPHIKTFKLTGIISQGLLLPLEALGLSKDSVEEEQDVTELVKATKYEPELPVSMRGQMKGLFPTHLVSKTDSIRFQSVRKSVIDDLKTLKTAECLIGTLKMDGTSFTFGRSNGEFIVCSRNYQLERSLPINVYWQIVDKYKLDQLPIGDNTFFQGEIVGPGVQKNPLKLSELKLYIFDVSVNGEYLDVKDMHDLCGAFKLEPVPIDIILYYYDLENIEYDSFLSFLLEKSKGVYENTTNFREGLVFKVNPPKYSEVLQGRFQFKIINNDYLD